MIDRINKGDESAKNILLKKYSYYAKSLAYDLTNKYEYALLIVDDLASIGLEQVIVALNNYDGINSFYPYWYRIAEREMRKMIERSFKHLSSISLDTTINENGMTLHDIVTNVEERTETAILFDTFINIVNDKASKLNENERIILTLFLEGYSFAEIAILLDCSRSRIYYQYKKAIRKVRSIIASRK